ncbi:hypothetical protein JL09_g6245 [Pichia kudriavzevii]|uniref:Uncharacterized protein n=1 Tax=Pichia kudriavzevii TaxID=4909 RepID=A0A099NRM9_PICKU|nr:hypothetical protein JL09_g6245 [Pichia kudriavzevii]
MEAIRQSPTFKDLE